MNVLHLPIPRFNCIVIHTFNLIQQKTGNAVYSWAGLHWNVISIMLGGVGKTDISTFGPTDADVQKGDSL